MRFPTATADLTQITRGARQLQFDQRDAYLEAVRGFLARDGDQYRPPSPPELQAAIEHGLAAVADGPAPIPMRLAEVDHTRPRAPPDPRLTYTLAAHLSLRARRRAGH